MITIKRFDFLVALYTTCIIMAELMGSKTFPLVKLFGYQLNASVAIFLLPLVFTINDVITEVFGKERARSVIQSGLVMIILLLGFCVLATALPPSIRSKDVEPAYDKIFGQSAWIAFSSLTAFVIAEFVDVLVFVKIREKLGQKALWLRNNASNFISQFFDTAIFMSLAFYSLEKSFGANFNFITSLILPYWLVKCSMSVLETPLVYLGVRWLKQEKSA